MLTGLNRSAPRNLASQADRTARLLARTCLDYDAVGHTRAGRDRRAVAVLERGFTRMLRDGGREQVLRSTVDAASAFPHQLAPEDIEGFPWLAVGLDRQARATYALRYLNLDGESTLDRRRVEVKMLDELSEHCDRPGFPPRERDQ